MSLVDAGVRSATVITRANCRVISINRTQFDALVRESPEFARHVMMVMADRLRRMNDRLKRITTRKGAGLRKSFSRDLPVELSRRLRRARRPSRRGLPASPCRR